MTQISLLPRPDDLPSFENAVSHLEHIPGVLFHALEHSAYETSVFRQEKCPKRRLDAGLAASLFRFHAIEYFREQGIEARADAWKWTLNSLPFLGISFYYNGYHVRVLKGPGGALPGCGVSRRKRRFYRQIQANYLIGNVPHRTLANLIVLWDLTPMYSLAGLWMALPADGGLRQKDVSAYWIKQLSHPATQISNGPEADDGDGLGSLIALPEREQEDNDRGASSAN